MIDLRQLREQYERIRKNIDNRHMHVDLDAVIELQEKRSRLIQQAEELRSKRNSNAKAMKGPLEQDARQTLIEEGKRLKNEIAETEKLLKETEEAYFSTAKLIPNFAHPDAPVGKEEKDNLEIRRWGALPDFDFTPRNHVEIAEDLDLIDFDTAASVTGAKFYYLRNDAVLLELALERYALEVLQKHGFTLTVTPDLAKQSVAAGIGFNPRGAESNIYTVEDTDLCLVGTAEITLGGYYANSILDDTDLPILLSGLSHCFRKEAGAAGQYSRGLYRVHQFSKVEMFVLCSEEQSEQMHEQMLGIEEEIFQGLNIPYRIVDTCTGDLGAPAYRKYDIEAWMPGRGDGGEWGEVTSTSNCTDYQARNLAVRYKKDGKTAFAHMLNGTAVAVSRAIVAILENNQEQDGSVRIPEVLQPWMGKDRMQKLIV